MGEKVDLDIFCDKSEKEEEKRQLSICKNVIDEYSKLCNVDFRKESTFAHNDYEVFDSLLQITVAKPELFEEFHEILQKNGFNDKTYIEYAIKKITQNASNVESFVNGLLDIGLVDEVFDNEDNSICLKSYMGDYNFFLANEYYVGNEEIVSYIENGDRRRNCHMNTLFLLKCLKQGEAVTSKCTINFNNSFYHSYYRYEGMICDLNINCVMNEKDYNSLYSPKIISVVNINNFIEKQNEVQSKCKSTLGDLLEIAVYEEICNRGEI